VKPLAKPDLWPQSRAGNELAGRRSRRVGTKLDRCVDEKHKRTAFVKLRATSAEREKWVLAASREGYLSLSDWMRDTCSSRARTRALVSADAKDVNTPPVILQAIKPLGPIGLDPFHNATSIVGAKVCWTIDDDSMPRDWSGYGLTFCNPEFGDFLPIAIEKFRREAARGTEIVCLVPARIETKWFDRMLDGADVGLWRGRISFLNANGNAPFPVALGYYGGRRALFRRTIEPHCVRVLEASSPVFRAAPDPRQLRLVR